VRNINFKNSISSISSSRHGKPIEMLNEIEEDGMSGPQFKSMDYTRTRKYRKMAALAAQKNGSIG
jgi:hypothetical protein